MGQKATSGNFCFGIGGKSIFELGRCADFSIYHLVDLKDGEEGVVLENDSHIINDLGKAIGTFHQTNITIGRTRAHPTGAVRCLPSVLRETDSPKARKEKVDRKAWATALAEMGVAQSGADLPVEPTLGDIASILRSKNAGPYEITFDVMFKSEEVFRSVQKSEILTKETIAHILGVSEAEIIWSGFFAPALAFKVTIPRKRRGQLVSAGGFMENDVHGSQQYQPLMNMKLPSPLVEQLQPKLQTNVH